MVVLLEEAHASLGSSTADRLARLGVTRAVLLRDGSTTGLVLEGWAFDPFRSGQEVLEALAPPGTARALHPVGEMTVSRSADSPPAPRPWRGETDARTHEPDPRPAARS